MMPMFEYDLHTHTTFSDGELIPAESARRAKISGYKGIAFTDHADHSNYEFILENQLKLKKQLNALYSDFKVLVGLELTHVPPELIKEIKENAIDKGADIIVVHGETIVEPVTEGTNRAAIEAEVDILSHPGLITKEEAELAAAKNVFLEITTRKGHSLTNGHVASVALKTGAKLVINNDFHAPGDAVTSEMASKIMKGSGLTDSEIKDIFENNRFLFKSKLEG